MKVMVTTDAVGGVWTYAMELARALRQRDHEVVLACMGPAPSDEQRREVQDVGAAVHAGDFRLEWMQDPWSDVERASAWLADLEAQERPDLVHLNGYAHGALPWRAPVLVVGHSCVMGWWDAVHGTLAPPEWDEYRRRVREGISAAHAVAAPTRAVATTLARHYGPLQQEVHVIPNGRTPDRFASASRKEPFVLAVGRLWDDAKDVATLDEAAADLPWPVRIAGDARNPETGLVRELSHAEALGRVGDAALRDLYARAGVYALPARYEPFGLGALEAALSGCALALADLPSLREVWGDAALYAQPGDAGTLRDILRRYAQSPTLRARMARKARERARRYTSDRMAEAYLTIYDRLLEARRKDADLGDGQEASTCAS